MSLRKSPRITPALLVAKRANARKCTGPRTPRGKGLKVLNTLKLRRPLRPYRWRVSNFPFAKLLFRARLRRDDPAGGI